MNALESTVLTPEYLADFATHYTICALWAGLDWDDMEYDNPRPLDDNYGPEDVSDELAAEIREECAAFITANAENLALSGLSAEQAGHDFYLTRCGHGTGYWDRGLPDPIGDELSAAAKVYGESSFYAGDDGKLYAG